MSWAATNITCTANADCWDIDNGRYECGYDGFCGCAWPKQAVGPDCTASDRSAWIVTVNLIATLAYISSTLYFLRVLAIQIGAGRQCRLTFKLSTVLSGLAAGVFFIAYLLIDSLDLLPLWSMQVYHNAKRGA